MGTSPELPLLLSPLSEELMPELDVTSPTLLEPSMLPRGRLRLMPTTWEDTELDTPVWDTLDSDTLDSDTLVWDTLDSDTPVSDTPASDTLVWEFTTERGRPRLSLRLRLNLTTDTLDSDTLDSDTLDSDTLVSDTLVLDTLVWESTTERGRLRLRLSPTTDTLDSDTPD